jgi:hypothetical protein
VTNSDDINSAKEKQEKPLLIWNQMLGRSLPVVPYNLAVRPDKKDNVLIGHSLALELYNALAFPVVDSVAHTILRGKHRGEHYHPKETGKIEVFVPLIGSAMLEWHETGFPTPRNSSLIMRGIWPKALTLPERKYIAKVYHVYPETCS